MLLFIIKDFLSLGAGWCLVGLVNIESMAAEKVAIPENRNRKEEGKGEQAGNAFMQ